MEVFIRDASSEPLLTQVREIFREYQKSLGIDLGFQNFEEELAGLPGKYAPPRGRIYLAFFGESGEDGAAAGCIALRPLDGERCEMKRLYVRPAFRGHDLGRKLAERVVADARAIGYSEMLLDTLPDMSAAQALYRSLGFLSTDPYCFNPIERAQYMALALH